MWSPPPPLPPLALERKELRFLKREEALRHPGLLSFQRLQWAIERYFTHDLLPRSQVLGAFPPKFQFNFPLPLPISSMILLLYE